MCVCVLCITCYLCVCGRVWLVCFSVCVLRVVCAYYLLLACRMCTHMTCVDAICCRHTRTSFVICTVNGQLLSCAPPVFSPCLGLSAVRRLHQASIWRRHLHGRRDLGCGYFQVFSAQTNTHSIHGINSIHVCFAPPSISMHNTQRAIHK